MEGETAGVYQTLASLQEKLAFLPNYSFKKTLSANSEEVSRLGTSLSGIVGGLLTLGLVGVIGLVLKGRTQPSKSQ